MLGNTRKDVSGTELCTTDFVPYQRPCVYNSGCLFSGKVREEEGI